MNKKVLLTTLAAATLQAMAAGDLSTQFDGISLAKSYKGTTDHNPMISTAFGADPYAMEYDGRLYVYMTHDVYDYDSNGEIKSNEYGQIHNLYIISSADLVNWTDHGSFDIARSGPAKWASCSWAPTAAHKTINGQEKFFLYFANNGSGIGVVTGNSPVGPWSDPIGKELISRSTPNCATVNWLFDPAVLIDNNGDGYIYFGGGVPEGKNDHPMTARVAKLGDNMISLASNPATIDAPYLFEDAGANKIGDYYVYSYCTNWNCPNPGNAKIAYMKSKTPLSGYEYQGAFFNNPGDFFPNSYGNNHHALVKFQGNYYLVYHGLLLQNAMGMKNLGYRSSNIDAVTVDEKTGTISPVKGTYAGVSQLKSVNPLEKNEAETFAWVGGATGVNVSGTRAMAAKRGNWIGVSGVDFGSGAGSLKIRVASKNGAAIRISLDKAENNGSGYIEVPATGSDDKFTEVTTTLDKNITGKHDLFFVFSADCTFDYWQFVADDVPQVKLMQPLSQQIFVEGDTILLQADATIGSGSISHITYFAGQDTIVDKWNTPRTWAWTPKAGRYAVCAKAYSDKFKESASDTAFITVNMPRAPFHGSPLAIPGTVEAEDFDFGGEGFAYHDNDEEDLGESGRNEGPDIYDGALGHTIAGEWTEYTVNCGQAGKYNVKAIVASGNKGASFRLLLDGEALTDTINIPQTADGKWDTYDTVTVSTAGISAGEHILRLQITGPWGNIDKLIFEPENMANTPLIFSKPNLPADGRYAIANIHGQHLGLIELQGNTLSSSLPSGVYLLTNTQNGETYKITINP